MAFPQTRLRRLRASASLRGLVRETELRAGQLVLPLFVDESPSHPAPPQAPIATDRNPAPLFERLSISALLAEAHEVAALGLAGVMLFGIPAAKDAEGSGAWDEEGVIQTAVRALKRALPELLVLTDVCLCEYTDHGHCGVLREGGPGVSGDP
ncbi:MAG: porphobilinogen synthase, partial [Solirubrobacteraceae bacterium]